MSRSQAPGLSELLSSKCKWLLTQDDVVFLGQIASQTLSSVGLLVI